MVEVKGKCKIRKSVLGAFLMGILIVVLVLVGTLRFGIVYASTDVAGRISSDTTWTKAKSPYSLVGVVHVNNGVTLTIEAGTTVNLNGYYIQVDGTLVAKGSSVDPIQFYLGLITFTESSESWNEQTSSGSIIENAVLDITSILVAAASPKLTKSSISGDILLVDGAPVISNNTITGSLIAGGSSIVSHNNVMSKMVCSGSSTVSYNNIMEGVVVGGGTPTISNNNVDCGSSSIVTYFGGQEVTHAAIHIESGTPTIANNNITRIFRPTGGKIAGISLGLKAGAYIHDNIISGFAGIGGEGIFGVEVGDVTIERNLITRNFNGIEFGTYSGLSGGVDPVTIIVKNNTIIDNQFGYQGYYAPTFLHNNMQAYLYNIKISQISSSDIRLTINAAYNWWGTTDEQEIEDKLQGLIIYVPFLNESNPEVTPNITSGSLPKLTSTLQSNFPTQSLNNITPIHTEIYAIIAVIASGNIAFLIITLHVRRKTKLQNINTPSSRGSGEVD